MNHRYLAALFSTLLLLTGSVYASPIPQGDAVQIAPSADKYIRTELYFGQKKPGGRTVSDAEWQAFVDGFVTPRFPDGLTILEADGQWRAKDGDIVRERSKVIILLYPRKMRKTMNTRIEEVRAEYKRLFEQESVMRIDITRSVDVSF